MKASPSPPVRVGWLRAILIGHQRVAAGLDLACPVLVMCSTATDFSRRWHEGLRIADTVLDVEQIVQRATRLGRLVTILRVDQGLHDVLLSAPAVRKLAGEDMMHWGGRLRTRCRLSGLSAGRLKVIRTALLECPS